MIIGMFPRSDDHPFGDEKCCSFVLRYLRAQTRIGRNARCARRRRWTYGRPEMEDPRRQSRSSNKNSPHSPPGSNVGFDEDDEAGVQCSRDSRDDRSKRIASQSLIASQEAVKLRKAPRLPLFGIQRGFELRSFLPHRRSIADSFVARRGQHTEVLIG